MAGRKKILKRNNRYVLLVSLLVIVMSVILTGCSNKANIGYVDLNRVATESPQLKTLNDSFEKEYAPFAGQMEDLAKKKDSMSQDDYTKAAQDLQRKVYSVQQKYNAQRKSIMDKVLEQISKEKNLSAVTVKAVENMDPTAPEDNSVNIDGVVVQGGTDITDEVIQKLQ